MKPRLLLYLLGCALLTGSLFIPQWQPGWQQLQQHQHAWLQQEFPDTHPIAQAFSIPTIPTIPRSTPAPDLTSTPPQPLALNPTHTPNTTLYLLEKNRDLYESWPLSPLDYSILLKNLQEVGPPSLSIAPTLQWVNASELSQRALAKQLQPYSALRLGYELYYTQEETAFADPTLTQLLPPALAQDILLGDTSAIPTFTGIEAIPSKLLQTSNPSTTLGFTALLQEGQPHHPWLVRYHHSSDIYPSYWLLELLHTYRLPLQEIQLEITGKNLTLRHPSIQDLALPEITTKASQKDEPQQTHNASLFLLASEMREAEMLEAGENELLATLPERPVEIQYAEAHRVPEIALTPKKVILSTRSLGPHPDYLTSRASIMPYVLIALGFGLGFLILYRRGHGSALLWLQLSLFALAILVLITWWLRQHSLPILPAFGYLLLAWLLQLLLKKKKAPPRSTQHVEIGEFSA